MGKKSMISKGNLMANKGKHTTTITAEQWEKQIEQRETYSYPKEKS